MRALCARVNTPRLTLYKISKYTYHCPGARRPLISIDLQAVRTVFRAPFYRIQQGQVLQ